VVHVYAGLMAVGFAATAWFFTTPHANATVVDAGGGDYVVTAAPGVGYTYLWDADGDGKPDTDKFGTDTTVKVHLDQGHSVWVGLEVQNAFGQTKKRAFLVARPAGVQVSTL
jgi:hypothetical protein